MNNDGVITSYTYDKNNRLLTEGDITYTYDANSNTLTAGDKTYTYNYRGQQIGYTDGTVTATYAYNPSGLRSAKTVGGSTKYFVYNGMQIVFEYEDSIASGTVYYYGLNRTHSSDGDVYVYNAHGDTVQLVNDAAVVVSYTYDAFGNLTNTVGTSDNAFLYCSEYFDAETQTYYLRARYYNPANGRFTQEDPIGAGLNWYTYCSSNPISYNDPIGLDAILINKKVDNIANKIGVEHMGAFFQDNEDNWWFFFWGDVVQYVQVDDSSIFESLNSMNAWLVSHDLLNQNHPYEDSVYIKGDFTASHQEAQALLEQYVDSLNDKVKWIYPNKKYSIPFRNCSQETIRLFEMGILPNGEDVSGYIARNGYDTAVLPNVNMNNMQKLFFNSATNSSDFDTAIQTKLAEYKTSNFFVKLFKLKEKINLDAIS